MGELILNTPTTSTGAPSEAKSKATLGESGKPTKGAEPVHPLIAALTQNDLAPVFWSAARIGQTSAWWSHVPFAHWIVAACQPQLLVELGTHAGVSYSAFCEAVRNTHCGARCYAVDMWKGDAHSGEYDDSIYNELRSFNESRYSGFSRLIRARFDEALKYFNDKSIDILHIDGFHTYEAVSHDFNSWFPKLSDKAVVLFHDTNVKRDDFGVYKFFDEISQKYPCFEFSHGYGLGVVAVGADAPKAVLDLCSLRSSEQIDAIRERFAFLGNRWLVEARETLVVNDLHRQIGELQNQRANAEAGQEQDAVKMAGLTEELTLSAASAHKLTQTLEQVERDREITTDMMSQAQSLAAEIEVTCSAFLEDLRALDEGGDINPAPAQIGRAESDLIARLQTIKSSLVEASDKSLVNLQAALSRHLSESAAKASEIEDLTTKIVQAEMAVLRAEGERNTAERMRQNTVQRVSELRRALDAVGQETTIAREMSRALARRYTAALREARRAQRRDPVSLIRRMAGGLKGTRHSQVPSEDLLLLENSIYFDPAWYITKYPDVKAEGASPALHYLLHGAAEQRDPGPWFSTSQYLLNNPDVAAAGANALLHFLRHGEEEGRTANSAPALPLLSGTASIATQNSKMSCIFITGEPESAGHRYRVLDFIEASKANDVNASWVRADDLAGRSDELAKHDIAIFWRVAWTDDVGDAIACLRRSGCKIVFDVDDLMTEPSLARRNLIDGIRTQSLTENGVRGHYERVRQTMMAADACLATTEELALYMRGVGKTTYVVPNGFNREIHDLSRLALRVRRQEAADGLIRIGYAGGSRTHQRDFAVCAAAVAQTLRENPHCRLVLFRNNNGPLTDPAEFPELARLAKQIEWRDAVPLNKLPLEMARFDINLAPLEFGNAYCEAKSELKFFEAALVEVPTIASPTGPFRRAIDHGKTGFLAATADDWLDHLRRLIDDKDLRTTTATAAYRSALARFGPETKALRFGNVLEQLRGGVAAARAFALDIRLVRHQPPAPKVYPSEIVFESDRLGSADVSVVVPLYNYESFVEETLDSVLAQTAPVLDLIIVDGHSTDNSLAVASSWAKRHAERFNRIVVMQNSANYGLGFCRNSGFDAAETPYIVLLDADNKLVPEACSELAEHAKRTGAAFVYPTIQHFGASTALMGNAPFEAQKLAAGNYIDAMALVSKEAWAMVGGVDHVRHGWEDYDFWCRIAELGLRGEWLDRILGLYRVHPTSMQTVQTTVPDNHRHLLENFESRHPWVWLNGHEPLRAPPAQRNELLQEKERTRLDRLLPILRCPVTHEKLGYDTAHSALSSYDGFRTWQVREGRPVFIPSPADVVIHPKNHQSNSLPEIARELIREAKGWVLNLSAGGTEERFDNVVETEYAIFRHTDVVADAHNLPFGDEVFDAAIVLNAFEHYSNPQQAVAELYRVLKPGGKLLIVTAFMQPLHEGPYHFYNCTRYGLEEWFKTFETERLEVGPYLSPNFTMGWVASEVESALRHEQGEEHAEKFLETDMRDIVSTFRDPSLRNAEHWENVQRLSQAAQEVSAAGFEFVGRKGNGIPIYTK